MGRGENTSDREDKSHGVQVRRSWIYLDEEGRKGEYREICRCDRGACGESTPTAFCGLSGTANRSLAGKKGRRCSNNEDHLHSNSNRSSRQPLFPGALQCVCQAPLGALRPFSNLTLAIILCWQIRLSFHTLQTRKALDPSHMGHWSWQERTSFQPL